MKSQKPLKLFLFFLFVLSAMNLAARPAETAAVSKNWKYRETERFIIIYPESLSDKAAELSLALDVVAEMNALGEGPQNIPPHSHKKWPLILTSSMMLPNGYVRLAPRQSVWFSTPAEDFTATGDWWMLLARHEGRHMAQMDFADQGLTRFLHILFGQFGWGAGVVLGMPVWLMEGDAVVQETILSEEGRGRDALFTRELQAFLTEQEKASYRYLTNPSYKRYIPSHYHVGYALTSWIREEYGEEALKAVYRHCARLSLPVLGISRGTKEAAGKLPRELFEEMADALKDYLESAPSTRAETPSRPLLPPADVYSRYDSLCEDGRGGLYARKATMTHPSALVHISRDGEEKTLAALPGDGRVSITVLDNGRLRIVWNSIRMKPVTPSASVSDLTLITLNSKNRIIQRSRPATGSRYLYPSISPDGNSLAAVYMNRGSGCRLDIMDVSESRGRNSGAAVLHSLELPGETAGHPSWSADGKRLVFSLRSTEGRRIAEWTPGTPELREILPVSRRTVKRPVYSADGSTVFFTASVEGSEEILSVDVSENSGADEALSSVTARRVARRRWGAERPLPSQDGRTLYFVEYNSTQGQFLCKMELGGEEALLTFETGHSAAEEKITCKTAPPEKEWKPGRHVINFHSWGILPEDTDIKAFVRSDNILGTVQLETGALYEVNEKSPGAFTRLTFTGIRPNLSLNTQYRYRSPASDPFHQATVSLQGQLPMNLSRSSIWKHSLNLSAQGGLLWTIPAKGSGYSTAFPAELPQPLITGQLQWQLVRPGPYRSLTPRFGWAARTGCSQVFLPDQPLRNQNKFNGWGALRFYLPGAAPRNSLQFAAAAEYRSSSLMSRITPPRGSRRPSGEGTEWLATVDYRLPLFNSDWPLASLMFIQRFRLGLFSDFGFYRSAAQSGTAAIERRWSSGAELLMDFSLFNNFHGLNLGVRFSWLWQEQVPRFEVLLMDLPVY